MEHIIEDDRLILVPDEDDMARLHEDAEDEDFDSDAYMFDLLEDEICNSDLDWIDPVETGDLTDAPLLGIYGSDPLGERSIEDRWGFMDYQVVSVQRQMMEHGRAVFVQ